MSERPSLGRVAGKLREILTARERRGLAWLTAGSALLSVSEAFSIGILIPIMSLAIDPARASGTRLYAAASRALGASEPAELLWPLMLIAVALFWVKSAYALWILRRQQLAIGEIRARVKAEVFARYLARPYAFHLQNHSAVLFKNVVTDVAQFAVGFLASGMQVVSEALLVAGIFVLLLAVYPAATLAATAALGGTVGLLHVALRGALRRSSAERERFSEAKHKIGLEALAAVKEIQVYGAGDAFRERFAAAVRSYSDSFIRFTVLNAAPRHLLEAALFTAIMGGLMLSLRSDAGMTRLIPMLSAFALASLRVLPSVNKMQQAFGTAQFYLNSLEVVHGILSDERFPEPAAEAAPEFPAGPQEIRLSGVSFSFPGRPPLFDGLELAVPARATVAFVGESGAGKSTLADLLMGVLEPERGEVSYGGARVDAASRRRYWKRLGYVPQQIALLDDTIAENVSFGSPVDGARLRRALEAAQLSSLLSELPEGLETRIGERGVRLSGGQRQRIGIARALYREPDLLVLDEATSALDSATEAEIGRALQALKGRLTVVIIAHRLTTVQSADTLYVLDKGRIAARGSFGELSKGSPEFQRLARTLSAGA